MDNKNREYTSNDNTNDMLVYDNFTIVSDIRLKEVVGGLDLSATSPSSGSEVVSRALKEIGKPYMWGAVGPDGYDAPGFVGYCLTGEHIRIGTTSTFMGWPRVSDPQPGDICVSNETCGIYVGAGCMVIARTFGSPVSYSGIDGNMIIVRY